jgi:hypothetical protein
LQLLKDELGVSFVSGVDYTLFLDCHDMFIASCVCWFRTIASCTFYSCWRIKIKQFMVLDILLLFPCIIIRSG